MDTTDSKKVAVKAKKAKREKRKYGFQLDLSEAEGLMIETLRERRRAEKDPELAAYLEAWFLLRLEVGYLRDVGQTESQWRGAYGNHFAFPFRLVVETGSKLIDFFMNDHDGNADQMSIRKNAASFADFESWTALFEETNKYLTGDESKFPDGDREDGSTYIAFLVSKWMNERREAHLSKINQ